MSDIRCDQCHRSAPQAMVTATGRHLCQSCADTLTSVTFGMLASRDEGDAFVDAVGIRSLLGRVRKAMGRSSEE